MKDLGYIYDFTEDLTLERAQHIVDGTLTPAPAPQVWERCDASHGELVTAIKEARHIYGITTGFGPLANRLISPSEGQTLQQNLVHHLATGLGPPLSWDAARAVCLDRLVTITRGKSGASRATIQGLLAVLKSSLAPLLPERGTVGASGDLTPLAHLVLALQGRGSFIDRQGAVLSGAAPLERLGLRPLTLANRDALALVNGTSAMTGLAIINAGRARRLIDWSLCLSAALLEVLKGRAEAWSPVLSAVRAHPGQAYATAELGARIAGSSRIIKTPLSGRKLAPCAFQTEPVAGQDAYSLRCVPQVTGAVLDALQWHDQVVTTELNSVTDNPIFDHGSVVHGGNFMGQHIALVSDSLSAALVVLAGLAERQIARLTDEKLNCGLPPFLQQGPAGLNSGFMGAQVTATATLAEMRQRGGASIHSISTNGANQDVVSMGTIAARTAAWQLNRIAEILAIEALCVAQAIDITGCDGYSAKASRMYQAIRGISQAVLTDRPLSSDIQVVAAHLKAANPP